MSRFWGILFLLVPLAGSAAYLLAVLNVRPLQGMWLPETLSESGRVIDHLFNLIHGICAVIFLLTTGCLGWSLWKWGGGTRPAPAGNLGTAGSDGNVPETQCPKAKYIHGHVGLEVVWTLVPACILVFLSLYQYESWADSKMRRPVDDQGHLQSPHARVVAKQFGWEFYYPGPDGQLGTLDDVYQENELLVAANEPVVLQLESRDVIHSFFVPVLRIKQDIVPGMQHFCWFTADASQPGQAHEIACTELCGWGHYKMKAHLRILPREELDRQLAALSRRRMATGQSSELSELEAQQGEQ